MAAPSPESDEAAVIDKLRSERTNRAELFFRNAKSLADPVTGFEDADFWSIQALLLISLYMLAISKRNASYAYYGECSYSIPFLSYPRLAPNAAHQGWQYARLSRWDFIEMRVCVYSWLRIVWFAKTSGRHYLSSIGSYRHA
jgi:hypothetical protein